MDFLRVKEAFLEAELAIRYYDPENAKMRHLQEEEDRKVEAYLASIAAVPEQFWEGLERPEGVSFLEEEMTRDYSLWEDISSQPGEYRYQEALAKLLLMAKSHENPNSSFYQSKNVRLTIFSSLKALGAIHYHEQSVIEGNWWCYEIGAPRALVQILLLLEEHFTREEINYWTDRILQFSPNPHFIMSTVSEDGKGYPSLGGNLMETAKVHLFISVLRKDEEKMKSSVEAIHSVFTIVTEGNGFYEDYSYIDHGSIAYSGAYGVVLMTFLSELLPYCYASSYLLAEENKELLVAWIKHAYFPLLHNGECMDMVRGRSLSRRAWQPHSVANDLFIAFLRIAHLAGLSEEASTEIIDLCALQMQKDKFYDHLQKAENFRDLYFLEQALAKADVKVIEKRSHHLFSSMAKFVARFPDQGFSIGISAYSQKIQNYEYMNNENSKGWYVSDMALSLYDEDPSRYSESYQATVNPYRRSGTTVVKQEREDGSGETVLPEGYLWMKGFSVDANGEILEERQSDKIQNSIVAMDFSNWDRSLRMKKSYFIVGEKIVCLGAGIETTEDIGAETSILQEKITRATKDVFVFLDGERVSDCEEERVFSAVKSFAYATDLSEEKAKGLGIRFLRPTEIQVQVVKRQGTWHAINTWEDERVEENRFMSLVQEHSGDEDSYAYVMYPSIEAEEFSRSQHTEIVLLENTKNLQVVYDKEKEILAIAKYQLGHASVLEALGMTIEEKGLFCIRIASEKISAILD